MAYEYANVKSQSFWSRKNFQGKKNVNSVEPGKKKKDAKTLLIYSQGDRLNVFRDPIVRSCVSVASAHLSRWSDSHRYDKHQISNRLSQLRAARHYGAYLYSAIPEEKTNSGQIFEVKYLSELSSFSRLHTPGMLNAFSWHACFMCGLLTISVLFLGNNENSQWSQGRLAETHTQPFFLLFEMAFKNSVYSHLDWKNTLLSGKKQNTNVHGKTGGPRLRLRDEYWALRASRWVRVKLPFHSAPVTAAELAAP